MIKKRIVTSIIIGVLLVISFVSASHHLQIIDEQDENGDTAVNSQNTLSIPIEFGQTYTKKFNETWNFKPKMPDIQNYIEQNISSYTPANTTVYLGNDIISELSLTYYTLNVTLLGVYVVHDHDSIGSGDISLKVK